MINLDDYTIFHDHTDTLKELSKDDSDVTNVQYMTDSHIIAVDFDEVKKRYANSLNLSEETSNSVDAILQTESALDFIEFKNGAVNNRNIRDKILDSLLIFCDITATTVDFSRRYIAFTLVYNEEKNPLPNQYTKGIIQNSPSRRYITKRIAQMGKQELVLFGLDRYKKLYFRDIHTYTKEEFAEHLEKLDCQHTS